MELCHIGKPFLVSLPGCKVPLYQVICNFAHRSFVGTVFAFLSLYAGQSFPVHQSLDFLVVHSESFVLQLGGESSVSVHPIMFRKDLFYSDDQGFVLLILVFLSNAVIVCGPTNSGDLQQDLKLILLPQFIYNGYFFFRCRAFLA